VYVILVAATAIVAAAGVMVWPQSSQAGKHVLTPPPAPERMNTNPMPAPRQDPQPQPDPWGPPHAQLAPQPRAPQGGPRQTPDPVDPADPTDPFGGGLQGVDPFASPHGLAGGSPLAGQNAAGLAVTIGKHMCERIAKCGTSAMMTSLCNAYTQLPAIQVPTCAKAQKCIEHVDNLSCTDASDMFSPWEVMQQVQDCVDAMQC
jgi:hypothetical protein